ncbi:glutathione S-transferase-like [Argopecten irradians]|uniref:glutathione S-transferase-like n=1 Tax=Argopecten irradians TaxID=31199 RepID=UPI00371B0D56
MAAKKYTVTYFDLQGRAEATRLALSAAGVDFKDVRVTREEFQTMKPTLPQGQLPIMEVEFADGKKTTFWQSGAMCRFVAREHGLYGDTNEEMTMVDLVLGTLDDIFVELIKFLVEKDEVKKAEINAELGKTVIPKFVKVFADIKKDNEWMVGSKLTIADISVFSLFDQMPVMFGEEILEAYRNNESLQAHSKAVLTNKGIQKWIDTRPKPKMPEI